MTPISSSKLRRLSRTANPPLPHQCREHCGGDRQYQQQPEHVVVAATVIEDPRAEERPSSSGKLVGHGD